MTYADAYLEELTMDGAGALSWVTDPKPISGVARADLVHHLLDVCRWLAANGGAKLEVEEE